MTDIYKRQLGYSHFAISFCCLENQEKFSSKKCPEINRYKGDLLLLKDNKCHLSIPSSRDSFSMDKFTREQLLLVSSHGGLGGKATTMSALELHSRAALSVGVMYHSSGPNIGSNPRGGRIQKKKTYASWGHC